MPADRTYGGKALREREEERKARLRDAAIELFGSQGYAATTLQQVCSQARVAPRHFYESFESRESLLVTILDDFAREGIRLLSACPVDVTAGAEAFLHNRISMVVRYYGADPRLTRILCIEVVGVSDRVEARRREKSGQFVQLIVDDLQRLVESRQIPPRNYLLTAIAMVGAVDEMLTEWVLQPETLSIDTIIEEATRLFLAAVS